MKEILHTDDLVLLGDSWGKSTNEICRWEKAMTVKSWKENMNKKNAVCNVKQTIAYKLQQHLTVSA